MKRYKVLMSEPASEDLEGIARYIKLNLCEPITAMKLVGKIKEAVMSLAETPARHALAADHGFAAQGIRRLLVENYIVFYIVNENENTVTVIRILYSRRNWEYLL